MDYDVELDTYIIPENFVDTGRCFNGMFKTRNLIEAGIVCVPIFLILMGTQMSNAEKFRTIAIVVGGLFALFISGINGDSVFEFLFHFASFRGAKRVAKYNPRIKHEATPGYLTKDAYILPRERIIRLYKQLTGTMDTVGEDEVSSDIHDPMYKEFFEDDIGVVEKPYDLMNRKEKKDYRKKKKAEAREAKREARLKAKQDKLLSELRSTENN